MDFSIVVPVFNGALTLKPLLKEINFFLVKQTIITKLFLFMIVEMMIL